MLTALVLVLSGRQCWRRKRIALHLSGLGQQWPTGRLWGHIHNAARCLLGPKPDTEREMGVMVARSGGVVSCSPDRSVEVPVVNLSQSVDGSLRTRSGPPNADERKSVDMVPETQKRDVKPRGC